MPQFRRLLSVSTAKQGASGLGVEAQQAAVASFIASKGADAKLLPPTPKSSPASATIGLNSRRRWNMPVTGATLLIAKLDRLSRDAHFLIGLQKAGVSFVAADMPEANALTVGNHGSGRAARARSHICPDQVGTGASEVSRRPGRSGGDIPRSNVSATRTAPRICDSMAARLASPPSRRTRTSAQPDLLRRSTRSKAKASRRLAASPRLSTNAASSRHAGGNGPPALSSTL